MGAYNIVSPSSLVAGQPEDVSQVLANFQAIQAVLNGGVDDSNVNAAAAIQLSKVAIPAYTAYTPAWLCTSGGNPVLGNGTLNASYLQIGKYVHGIIQLTMGTTTTYGGGGFLFSLPASAVGAGGFPAGVAVCSHTGVNTYPATPSLWSATQISISTGSPLALVTATAPFTFVAGDTILINFMYEAS